MVLKPPQPTPTIPPRPTNTLSGSEATLAACGSYDYVVKNTDTLFGIALNFGVSTDIIREYNGLANDIVVGGSTLHIPLCERVTPGPTSTPTNPPPMKRRICYCLLMAHPIIRAVKPFHFNGLVLAPYWITKLMKLILRILRKAQDEN
jgi:hypothetical protein